MRRLQNHKFLGFSLSRGNLIRRESINRAYTYIKDVIIFKPLKSKKSRKVEVRKMNHLDEIQNAKMKVQNRQKDQIQNQLIKNQ